MSLKDNSANRLYSFVINDKEQPREKNVNFYTNICSSLARDGELATIETILNISFLYELLCGNTGHFCYIKVKFVIDISL